MKKKSKIHLKKRKVLLFSIPLLLLILLSSVNALADSGFQSYCVEANKTGGDQLRNTCNADLDKNGLIDRIDFELFSAYFAEKNLNADLNASGDLNDADIIIFMDLYKKKAKLTKKSKGNPALDSKTIKTNSIKVTNITAVKTDLIARWLLNEDSGTTAKDISGLGYDGELINSPTWDNGNLIFDGVDDYVNVGAIDIKGKAISLSAWAQADRLGNCELRDCRIISKATGSDKQQHYWMLSTIKKGNKTRLRFSLKANGFTTELIASSGDLINGEIFHVVAVYDGAFMRLYKNGIEIGNVAKTGRIDTSDSVDVWIGNSPHVDNSQPWKGAIADVRIYQKALSEIEVVAVRDDFGFEDR